MRLVLGNLLWTLIAPCTVAIYLPLWLARDATPAAGWWRIAAAADFAVGVLLYAWCVWHFAARGRGTPAPMAPPRRLVIGGPYRFLRNPMYVGVLAVILGWTILYRSRTLGLYAACIAAVFHAFIVLYEEGRLRRQFGSEYDAYRARVGRWWPERPPYTCLVA